MANNAPNAVVLDPLSVGSVIVTQLHDPKGLVTAAVRHGSPSPQTVFVAIEAEKLNFDMASENYTKVVQHETFKLFFLWGSGRSVLPLLCVLSAVWFRANQKP